MLTYVSDGPLRALPVRNRDDIFRTVTAPGKEALGQAYQHLGGWEGGFSDRNSGVGEYFEEVED